jgi:hypothetical protein
VGIEETAAITLDPRSCSSRSCSSLFIRLGRRALYVRYTPLATELMRRNELTRCANRDLTHCSKRDRYSITSSARASSVGGTVRPSAFAVLRLITRSNLVGCSTGRSAGRSPLRMRST